MGFVVYVSDACGLVHNRGVSSVYLILYADELLIGFVDNGVADEIKSGLLNPFQLSDLNQARLVLGIEVYHNQEHGKLHTCQSQFIERLTSKLVEENLNAWMADGKTYIANGTRPDICVSLYHEFMRSTIESWDLSGDAATRKETPGVLVLFGSVAIVFKSQRQCIIALSSTKTAHLALSLTT
ncbi:FOG: Transposon-encoded proteins with TYA, reverse transcriptase, integrase domains in various combinations [Plasmopara halstedii]|uniref:FOG: Transposon-encoded proteins with TYA, reverse transcriptase, integrase domains in various combinations n=1 Tax=Plasmopara halstedii TaxID=4781 RepID=A0A0P1ACQ9_PLAHL|nr:FOG: Transposon-encoded proteins with TYA, reverse transcriptase, integrase domains in various combinations [Plasmopara halstedii]CEG38756.1 FOG: Transposon-encoded proteins with TYA, reverse transcriptase, integrase domains in various combinations [Plasmopara halstedii]|eukprot:XP_024575125.1 FOG: Transposon-encoded proteins with TYA, reverse transcriptase, integrase domains in various combinations [Plasmopara halstedii]